MQPEDYPTLFQESDRLAVIAQRKQFVLVRLQIILLLIATLLLAVPWRFLPALSTPSAFTVAVILASSTVLTVVAQNGRYDKVWGNCRAIAEAIKTESWLFMMRAPPYAEAAQGVAVQTLFLDRISDLLRLHESGASHLALELKEGPQITATMEKVYQTDLLSRRDFYVKNRLRDQRFWYASKAKWNRTRGFQWFSIAWLLQIGATVAAILVIVVKDTWIDPVGIAIAAVVGVLSWLNSRSYNEPAESYGIVAQELVLLQDRAARATTEETLAKIVVETEGAIIREQKIWLARI